MYIISSFTYSRRKRGKHWIEMLYFWSEYSRGKRVRSESSIFYSLQDGGTINLRAY